MASSDFFAGFDKQTLRIERPLTPDEGKALVAEIARLRAEVERLQKERNEHMAAAAREQTWRVNAERAKEDVLRQMGDAVKEATASWREANARLRGLLARCLPAIKIGEPVLADIQAALAQEGQ